MPLAGICAEVGRVVLNETAKQETQCAAGLAAEAGYADQAHLIRESRRLAGSTPREIARLFAGELSTGFVVRCVCLMPLRR